MWGDRISGCEAEIKLADQLPADLKKELLDWHFIKLPPKANEKEIKQEIREGISESPIGMEARVLALITNPVTKNALSKMLIELGVSEDSKAISV